MWSLERGESHSYDSRHVQSGEQGREVSLDRVDLMKEQSPMAVRHGVRCSEMLAEC